MDELKGLLITVYMTTVLITSIIHKEVYMKKFLKRNSSEVCAVLIYSGLTMLVLVIGFLAVHFAS